MNKEVTKFCQENDAKFGPKCCQIWPKSSVENCCKIQMRSISAMNSQSSMHQPGKIVAKFGRKIVAKNGREKFGQKLLNTIGKRLQNSNLWVFETSTEAPTSLGMPQQMSIKTTFWWEASVDQDFYVDRDHVVHAVVSMSIWGSEFSN